MKTLDFKGEVRADLGSKGAADLRRAERIPCVVYGDDSPLHFSLTEKELRTLVYTPKVFFANIELDGKTYKAAMKEVQFHPVTDALLHVDFHMLNDSKALKMEVPVSVTGNSIGVRNGGKLAVNARKLKVSALPANMPDEVTVDISNLNIGDALRIKDIVAEGVEFLAAPNVVVAAVRMTRSARSAQQAAAADGKK
jgi:large subunit ribosomal protein L25